MLNETEDYIQLLPQYKYSKVAEYRTILTDEEIRIFMNLLLYPKPIFRKEKSLLLSDLAQDYLANRNLTKDTLKGYKSQLKYNILPYFGEIQINKITYKMIVDFMQKMKENTNQKPQAMA